MGRFAKIGLFHLPTQHDRSQVKQALEEVDMWRYKDRLIGDLSGGQQQRVFIARALSSQPEIIFLDEPTTGVDQATQDEFYKLLSKLNKEKNITLVLVSHDVDVIAREVTELACINKTLIYDGNPRQFLNNPTMLRQYGEEVVFIDHGHHGH